MKKLSLLILSLVTIFTLSACNESEAGIFFEEQDLTITLGDILNPYYSVSAKDNKGEVENIREVVEVTQAIPTVNNRVSEIGTYIIGYKATLDGEVYEQKRNVEVTAGENNSNWYSQGITPASIKDGVSFSYEKAGEKWWDLHAVYPISNHDSSKNVLKSTVIGVEGDEYILKVESSTGLTEEVSFVGTGAIEEVEIELSPKFYESDLAALNKIILFNSSSQEAGIFIMLDLEFIAEEANAFNEGWSTLWGGVYQDKNNVVFPKMDSGDFWDMGAIYSVNGFADTEAVSIEAVLEEGHTFIFKLKTSTGLESSEFKFIGTGEKQTLDILANFTASDFRNTTQIIAFSDQEFSGTTSSIEFISIEGVKMEDVKFQGTVTKSRFYNDQWLEVLVVSNVGSHATQEKFNANVKIDGFDNITKGEIFFHGDGYLVFRYNLGQNFETNKVYNVDFELLYNGTLGQKFDIEISTVIDIPTEALNATIKDAYFKNGNMLEVQVTTALANHNNVSIFIATLVISEFTDISVYNFYYHGDGYIVYEFLLGDTYQSNTTYNYELTIEVSSSNKQTLNGSEKTALDTPEFDDITIPEGMNSGSLSSGDNPDFHGDTFVLFAIDFPNIKFSDTATMKAVIKVDGYPDAEVLIAGQFGVDGLHMKINFGSSYEENPTLTEFDFTIIILDANNDVVGYYNN